MAISAIHEDKNQINAGVCNSGFRANNLIFTILIAVQVPPPGWVGYQSIRHNERHVNIYPPRETSERSRIKIATQLFFVSTFILHAKNDCMGVETATWGLYYLGSRCYITMLRTRMRGSEATRQVSCGDPSQIFVLTRCKDCQSNSSVLSHLCYKYALTRREESCRRSGPWHATRLDGNGFDSRSLHTVS